MLDPNFIRENKKLVEDSLQNRGMLPSLVTDFLSADELWKETLQKVEALRAKKNQLSKDDRDEAKGIKEQEKIYQEELVALEIKRASLLSQIPNVPEERVPIGKDESQNLVMREVGERPNFDFEPRDYIDLANGLIDTQRAAKVSGSRFGYLLGDAALLEFALIQYVLKKLVPHGFVPVVPPVLVKPEAMLGMGKGKFIEDGDAFYVGEDNLYLVGTAEDSIGAMHMDEVLDGNGLPLRYVGFSTAFRREAGSYGKDTKGILRVHQFDKVEMFSFVSPESSVGENEFLLERQEEIMQGLGLPYRVVHICTGDMGFAASNQYDIEAWVPSEKKYRETHSCSNTTDFQSRGLNIKYELKGNKELVHTLNATGVAIGRTIIAILENYQTKEGSVRIPEALQEYVGKTQIESPRRA